MLLLKCIYRMRSDTFLESLSTPPFFKHRFPQAFIMREARFGSKAKLRSFKQYD